MHARTASKFRPLYLVPLEAVMTLTARTPWVDRWASAIGAVGPRKKVTRLRYRTIVLSTLAFVLLATGLIFTFGLRSNGPTSRPP